MKKAGLIYLLGTLLMTVVASEAQSRGKVEGPQFGMWSWQQKAFETVEARRELLTFCRKEGIVQVDQHLSIHLKNGQGLKAIKHAEALRSLLKAAAQGGVRVNALRGEKDMFYAKKHEQTLRELEAIIALNQSQPRGQKFHGVKYDVEPYLSKEWKAGRAQRKTVMLDYLNFLVKARKKLRSKKSAMKLSVDVPFWWDKPEHMITFRGRKKPFGQHIQDLTDRIGIMSYRRKSADVLRLSKDELAYAKKIRKPNSVSLGLETIEIKGDEAFISFWGRPVGDFRTTVRELRKELRKQSSADLIMLHDYRGLKKYLGSGRD